MEKKIVGFTGAGGTGKSTLANAFCGQYNFLMVPSIVRETSKEYGITAEADIYRLSAEDRLHYQLALFDKFEQHISNHAQTLKESTYDGLVFDRTLADHFAYILYYSGTHVSKELLDKLQRRVMMNLGLFTNVFYFNYPPKFMVPADGYRYTDPAKETIIDSIVYREFHRFRDTFLEENEGFKFRHMIDGDVIDRLAYTDTMVKYERVVFPPSKGEFNILSRI